MRVFPVLLNIARQSIVLFGKPKLQLCSYLLGCRVLKTTNANTSCVLHGAFAGFFVAAVLLLVPVHAARRLGGFFSG